MSTDHGPDVDRAAKVAARLAVAAGLPIELLTVSHPRVGGTQGDRSDLLLRADLVRPAACTTTVVHADDIASALIQTLHDRPGALPVISTHSEVSGVGAWESALRATGRPALLVGPNVRDEPLPLERLDVALTEDVDADHLLTALEEWSESFAATVSLVDFVDEVGGAAELASRHSLYAAARSLRHRGLPTATSLVPSRHPAEALLALGLDAPAILAVTASRDEENRPRQQGLASEIVHTATRPVLLIPAQPSARRMAA